MNKEAKQREAFEHWYSEAGRWPKSVARGDDGHYLLAQANSSYEAWRAAVAALQQQPEPVAATALTEGFDGSAVVPGLNHSTVYLWYDSEERARAARAFILDVLAATPSTPQGETK